MPKLLDPGRIIALAQSAKPATLGRAMSTDYPAVLGAFLELLRQRQVPFVIVGGIALLQYVEGRNTDDIDLIISAPRLVEIPELEIRERTDLFAYGWFRGLRVDILFGEHPLFETVRERFTEVRAYDVGPLPTATVDGLILLKLFALPSLYRQFDYDRIAIYEADLTQLLARSTREDSFFLEIVGPHVLLSDRDELASILRDIRSRLRRMKRS